MAGLPWIKVYTDLPRDPRALHLADLVNDNRAWTYVLQMRLYFAERAPSGRVSGLGAVATVERAAGWGGERGALVSALAIAGFVTTGPTRDGEGTEILDADWAKEQGAHVEKVKRDAEKPRGNAPNVVSPSRDNGGITAGGARDHRGKSRELRIEKEVSASQEPVPAPERQELVLTEQKPGRRPRKPSAAERAFQAFQLDREARCAEVGETFVRENWPAQQQNARLNELVNGAEAERERFSAAWGLYLADDGERARAPAWSFAFFMSAGVRAKYETRAVREGEAA